MVTTRAQAQSFDRLAADYDRLGELGQNHLIGRWLTGVLPEAGERALDIGCGAGRHAVLLAERFTHVDAIDLSAPMIELAKARRPRPNIAYWRSDLHDVAGHRCYDLILSVLTLHHVADLHAALSRIETLLAPGGRAVVVDIYDIRPGQRSLWWRLRVAAESLVPVRLRLHALGLLRLSVTSVRRGPATAWRIYRLSTKREWLDHLVSDRPFSRDALRRSCEVLFPGCQFAVLGGPRGIGMVWDAPDGPARSGL
jgi:SAM-dependent methyltransferase